MDLFRTINRRDSLERPTRPALEFVPCVRAALPPDATNSLKPIPVLWTRLP
jgi:hypothetical protein